MNLYELQEKLPWTIAYSAKYQAGAQQYSDMQHALMHIMKSAGILAGMIDKADHGDPKAFDDDVIQKRTADFVMCALRIAKVCPTGAFDLEETVIDRMESVNGISLREKGRLLVFGSDLADCKRRLEKYTHGHAQTVPDYPKASRLFVAAYPGALDGTQITDDDILIGDLRPFETQLKMCCRTGSNWDKKLGGAQ